MKNRIALGIALAVTGGALLTASGCGKGSAEPSRPADPGAVSSSGTAPSADATELVGRWEKTDNPGMGMQVEFAQNGDALEGKVSVEPPNDETLRAIFTKRAKGDEAKGAEQAACFIKARTVGTVKFKRIRPAKGSTFDGIENLKMFSVEGCELGGDTPIPISLSFQGSDVLIIADAHPSSPDAKPRSTWKRVSRDSN